MYVYCQRSKNTCQIICKNTETSVALIVFNDIPPSSPRLFCYRFLQFALHIWGTEYIFASDSILSTKCNLTVQIERV